MVSAIVFMVFSFLVLFSLLLPFAQAARPSMHIVVNNSFFMGFIRFYRSSVSITMQRYELFSIKTNFLWKITSRIENELLKCRERDSRHKNNRTDSEWKVRLFLGITTAPSEHLRYGFIGKSSKPFSYFCSVPHADAGAVFRIAACLHLE